MKLAQHVNQGQLVYLSNDADQITVCENKYYRWLAFDDVIQSVMQIRCPEKLTLPHHYAVLMPLLFFKPQRVIELGLGGGNISRFLTALHNDLAVLSVELSRNVINCFDQFFNPLQHNITIENNRFVSGDYGIYLRGFTTSSLGVNAAIMNNIFENQSRDSLRSLGTKDYRQRRIHYLLKPPFYGGLIYVADGRRLRFTT